ncbi:SDR family NAD(P)-dependent oxidoreductase, partial [Saccharothrix coeruleofusca]|uniref:SDR family NAD(P)-dependent oxidoreductase n=1 Tax=Saccharothrix coeruleofusca TaxID=33919 RepID=UPI00166F790F
MEEIECRVALSPHDFALRGHRVRATPVLPAVAFLDLVYRVLEAAGLDHRGTALDGVTFRAPLAVADEAHRDLRCALTPPAGGRAGRVDVASRVAGSGDDWTEHMTARLSPVEEAPRPDLPVALLRERAERTEDLSGHYARARAAGIEHDAAMRCTGTVFHGRGERLAELRLERRGDAHEDRFPLHPAVLDAATVVGFGADHDRPGEPFVPVFVKRFHAVRPLRGTCYVHVPRPAVASGEVVTVDFTLHDEHGALLAECTGMTWKRLAGGGAPAGGSSPATGTRGGGATVAARVRALVAAHLGRRAEEVDPAAGFYDLGLDSLALLKLGREVEELVGEPLYPTLLFEHGTVTSLAEHLERTYDLRFRDEGAPSSPESTAATPPQSGTTTCWTPGWVEEDGPRRDAAPLVAIGPDWFTGALGRTEPGLVPVLPGTGFAPRGAGYELDPADTGQVDALFDALAGRSVRDVVVHVAEEVPTADTCTAVYALAAALVRREHGARLTALCEAPATAAALGALARTVMAETPRLRCRAVLGADPRDPAGTARIAAAVARDDSAEAELDFSTGRRRVRRWSPAAPTGAPTPLREGGVYLITGGGGGLAGVLTEHLVRRYRARVALVGRGPAGAGLERRMAQWRDAGGDVRYLRADITDPAEAARAVGAARAAFGRVDGVVHAAAERRDGVYLTKRRDDVAAVLAPKVGGALTVDAVTAGDRLDFFAVFSSSSASTPNQGQSDYAAANAFLEQFARQRAARSDRAGRSVAIGWPYWAEGGMRVADGDRSPDGQVPMPTAEGLALFERLLADGEPQVTVLHGVAGVAETLLPTAPADAGPVDARPRHAEVAGAEPAVARDRAESASAERGIAIIGVAGRYPQAPDLAAFWRDLERGVDRVTEVPADRWDHSRYFDPVKGRAGRTYGKWGGFLAGVDRFDPAFFGISRREAERMDPQERLFLSTCWHALEDAGYPPEALRGRSVGVFAGVMWNHYQLVEGAPDGVAPSALHTAVPNRVSYTFDLTGPSFAVDTACSASLTAIHQAVASLRRGECDLALAGGVNAILHPQKYLQLAQGQWLSEDGRCRSFGKDGSGYVPGEGVGAVLLKPLDRALADGDHVHAVIRGSAINHSGRTSGVTVPSPGSQAALITAALRDAGWDPASVDYVEAHGTGTALGDPIEVEGLRQVFGGAGHCVVGSVKSNIGHLESAAGIAGLTKVLLQLRHGTIAPSLHAAQLNPHIDFASTPFTVPARAVPWPRRAGAPRRAGISAFGAGGANAHLLVEEAPPQPRRPRRRGPWLFVLSAKTEEALREQARGLAAHLAEAPTAPAEELVARVAARLGVPAEQVDAGAALGDLGLDHGDLAALADDLGSHVLPADLGLDHTLAEFAARCGAAEDHLADVAYTLQVGRAQLEHRLAVVAESTGRLVEALDRCAAGERPGAGEFRGTATATDAEHDERECADAFRDGRLAEAAAGWVAGADLPWARLHPDGPDRPRRVPLPGYPFQEERCWPGHWEAESGGRTAPARQAPPAERPRPRPAPQPAPQPGAEVDLRVLDGGVALVSLHAPTFTDGLIDGLEAAFADIAAADEVRAVVVTGGEGIFSMGGSAEALTDLAAGEGSFTDRPFVYEGLLRCDRPVVCAMRGHAAGGGLTFGLYADVVVMSEEAEYRANFLTYGFTPGLGATYILERRLGSTLAAEMLLTGRALSGAELARRGADVTVVPGERVLATALELARSIAGKPAAAVRTLKAELARRVLAGLPEVIDAEAAMHAKVLGEDARSLVEARFPGRATARRPAPAEPAPAEPAPAEPAPAEPAPVVLEPVAPEPVAPEPVAP